MSKNTGKQGKQAKRAGKGPNVKGRPGGAQGTAGAVIVASVNGQVASYMVTEAPAQLISLYEQGVPIRATLESGALLAFNPRVVLVILSR